jgi:hypothetical protein
VKLVGTDKLTLEKILSLPSAARTDPYGSFFVELKSVVSVAVRAAGKIGVLG